MSTQRTKPVSRPWPARRSLFLSISPGKAPREALFGMRRRQCAPMTVRLTTQETVELRRALETEVKRLVIACSSSAVQELPTLRSRVETSLGTLSDVLTKLAGTE